MVDKKTGPRSPTRNDLYMNALKMIGFEAAGGHDIRRKGCLVEEVDAQCV